MDFDGRKTCCAAFLHDFHVVARMGLRHRPHAVQDNESLNQYETAVYRLTGNGYIPITKTAHCFSRRGTDVTSVID